MEEPDDFYSTNKELIFYKPLELSGAFLCDEIFYLSFLLLASSASL